MMENNNTAFFICYVKLLRYQLKTPLISVPVLEQSNFAIGGEGGGEGLCYYMLTKILVMLASPGSIETGKTILRDKKTAGSCVFHTVF